MSTSKVRTLSRPRFWLAFAVAFGVFLLFGRQLWTDPFHMDGAIFWSYGVIPPMVIGLLALERRLSAAAVFLDVLELACLKFAATYTTATAVWALSDGPPPRPPPQLPSPPPRAAPARADVPAEARAAISGVVRGADGAPMADALVWVDEALEAVAFPVPTSSVVVTHDGRGFSPALSVVQVGQPLLARSLDGRLHTMAGNHPLLAGGDAEPVRYTRGLGVVLLDCSVHPEEPDTPEAHLAVLEHPLWARTDADGRYRIAAVPSGRRRLAVFAPGAAPGGRDLELAAGADASLDWTVEPAPHRRR